MGLLLLPVAELRLNNARLYPCPEVRGSYSPTVPSTTHAAFPTAAGRLVATVALAACARSRWPGRTLLRDHEIGRDRRKVEGLADEVAQRDNEIVRVHGMLGHHLPDSASGQPDWHEAPPQMARDETCLRKRSWNRQRKTGVQHRRQ